MTDIIPDWMEGESPKAAPTVTLAEVVSAAERALSIQNQIDEKQAELEQLDRELSSLQRFKIPDMLDSLGISEFKLEDGTKLKVEQSIQANISAANKPAAFRWLRENKFDGIIKTVVKADFGKGESEEASRAVALLDEAGFAVEMSETVHAATLKSFVKERLEAGDNIPVDVFGIFDSKIAKFTKPKRK